MSYKEIIDGLKARSNAAAVKGMARFGINPANTLGVSIPVLRKMAKEIGPDHWLAQRLWKSAIHEARILATMVDEADKVTATQMDRWAKDFDSWDVCDQCCSNLFEKTRFAHQKAIEWASKRGEYVKRAGFVLMAALAAHDMQANNTLFRSFLPIIKRQSTDERNFVKKAVNWALRQIGKRNTALNRLAIRTATEIRNKNSKAARWIASDAIRELESKSVRKKLEIK